MHNDEILKIVGILKYFIASAEEAEVGGLFVNAKNTDILRTTLE